MFRDLIRAARAKDLRFRHCQIERLECRDLLSAGPPQVVNVELASTSWSPEFVQYLRDADFGVDGYSIPIGSAAQATPLTWTHLNQVKITFSEDVRVEEADLSVSGVSTAAYAFYHFRYDPQTFTATWTLRQPIVQDRLRLDLSGNGLSPVRDLDGYVLDGEWTDNSSTYASGNGSAGGDFEFAFNVLPADVDGTGLVEYADYAAVASRQGMTVADLQYNPFLDIDGSGAINSADSDAAFEQYGAQERLPNGLPAGTYNDAPTTKGFALVRISDTALDTAIALTTSFADAESGGSGLAYSIVSNRNLSLFDYAYISSAGKLVLNAAAGAAGRANITIRAIDPGGLFTESTVTVDVNYQNVAPTLEILSYDCVGPGTWVISGYVSDRDDDLSKFIIDFYGVFETRTAVDENGYFEFAVILEPDQWGMEYAVTSDPHGYMSNEEAFWIGLT